MERQAILATDNTASHPDEKKLKNQEIKVTSLPLRVTSCVTLSMKVSLK
jgi:hypothetical protein